MSETVEINWVRGEMFAGRDRYGNALVIGSTPGDEIQFTGVKPSDLLVLGLMACAAYDVVNIIKKQRHRLEALRVTATTVQQKQPPHAFEKIHLHYHVVARGLKVEPLRRAIELAETKYCAVYNTLKHGVELVSDFELESE